MPLSAANDEALHGLAEAYANAIQAHPEWKAVDIGFSSAKRMHLKNRAAIVGSSTSDFLDGLNAITQNQKNKRRFRLQDEQPAGKKGMAFLYTGQGAQYAGMAKTLYESSPFFADALNRCDNVLKEIHAPSLIHTLYQLPPDDAVIHQTNNVQPALFAIEFALTELWKSWGIQPAAVMGHSIGEYAAAFAAGILPFEDGIRLAYYRRKVMQQLPENGGMAVVFLDEQSIKKVIQDRQHKLSLAAVNSPQCVTVSGDNQEIDHLIAELKQQKIAAKRLHVSHAFHSSLMQPVCNDFRAHLKQAKFNRPSIPMYSTVSGTIIQKEELHSPDYWIRQILQPVLFYPTLQRMAQDGYDLFLEIGPSNTLTALVEQCALHPTA